VFVLGQLGDQAAILQLQRTVLPTDKADRIIASLEDIKFFLENQPVSSWYSYDSKLTRQYYSAHGYLPKALDGVSLPDLVVKVICPATETHIKKYTAQERKMVVETPAKYEKVVVPYINSFPPSRIEWFVSTCTDCRGQLLMAGYTISWTESRRPRGWCIWTETRRLGSFWCQTSSGIRPR
jgi:m7GpppX diphosphatase